MARGEAHRAGAFEALFTSGHGGILEGSVSNVFFHDGNGLITAPDDQPILAGVTRQKILDIAGEMGIVVSFDAVRLQELNRDATSAFITGSVLGVCPVREIDGMTLRLDTGITGALSARLRELERASIG
jgi:branched-subunit amino acid aminotransferase/4-amino-4-deoxychorismate lyase